MTDSALAEIIGENDEKQSVNMWLGTGYPPLNKAVGGRYDRGFPVGRLVEMYGDPSSGKTAVATKLMIEAQRAGGIAMFNDHERSFDLELAENMGLDSSKRWVYKAPETFEESMTLIAKVGRGAREKEIIAPGAPIVAVVDSLASCVPKSVHEKEPDEKTMNDTTALARVASEGLKNVADFANKYDVLVLVLNQTRVKPGVMFGDPTTTPGGNATNFYASVRVGLTSAQIKNSEKETIGAQVTATAIKNKVTRPFRKAQWRFMFDDAVGGYFDFIGSMLEELVDQGILNKSGAWIEFDGKKHQKGKLIEKIRDEGRYDELAEMLTD